MRIVKEGNIIINPEGRIFIDGFKFSRQPDEDLAVAVDKLVQERIRNALYRNVVLREALDE